MKKLPTYFIRRFSEISDIHHYFTETLSENLYLPRNNYSGANKSITILGDKIWNSVFCDIKKKAGKIACCSKMLKKPLHSISLQ